MTKFLITTEHGTQIHLDTEKRTVLRKHSGDHPHFSADMQLKYHTFRVGPFGEPVYELPWKSAEAPEVGLAMHFQERGMSGAYYQSTTVVSIEEMS